MLTEFLGILDAKMSGIDSSEAPQYTGQDVMGSTVILHAAAGTTSSSARADLSSSNASIKANRARTSRSARSV